MQIWNPPVQIATSATKCGPLMVRYIIDGKGVLLPCDAKLYPPITRRVEKSKEPA